MDTGADEVVNTDEGSWLEDDDPEDCECGFPGEYCNCDEAMEWGDRCSLCRGTGWFIPEHCCACHGSPYCTCCRACGASCVSKCTCPIAVALEGGGELVV